MAASSRWRQDREVAELISHLNQPSKFNNWDSLTVSEYATVLKELDRCRADFVYAARNYFWITNKKLGDQLFSLWPAQELILQKIQELKAKGMPQKIVIIKARQLGAVDPDTKVLTNGFKWVRIDDLEPGEAVLSVDEYPKSGRGAGRKFRKARILRKWDVVKSAYKLTMDNGQTLVATGDHKFLCRHRGGSSTAWVCVNHKDSTKKSRSPIRVGDEIRFICPTWGGDQTFEDGWFAGLLDGEGSYRAKDNGGLEICVSQVAGSVLDRAVRYLNSRGYHFRTEVDLRKAGDSSKLGDKPVYKLVVNRMPEVFRLIGTLNPSRFEGRDCHEGKEIPSSGEGVSWSKVVSIEEIGERRMVDIETETGTFIAEGFVTHNCSTLIEGLIAWRTMFFSGVNALVVSYDQDHASAVLYPIMQFILDRMPWWLQPETASRKIGSGLFFENPDPKLRGFDPGLNSRIYVKGANSTTGVGQGIRLSAVHISEFCDFEDNVAKEIIDEDMVNALVEGPGTFAILESTPKGANRYAHKLWKQCVYLAEQAEWYPLFLPWFFESSRVRVVMPSWTPEKRENQMREQVEAEWVRCDNAECLQYHNRFLRGEDRAETACVTCNTGTVHAYELTDQQLSWMEHRRKNAARDDDSLKKLKQEMACVTGDSRISTEQGIIRIDEAQSATTTETGVVEKWYDHGERETLLVETKLRRRLVCTPEHEFFFPDGERLEAALLRPGQKISLSVPEFAKEQYTASWGWCPTAQVSVQISEDWGRLLGYFMGDGCWIESGLRFSCDGKDQDVVADIAALCERIIGTKARIVKRNDNHYLVESSNIRWLELMKGLGCLDQYVKHTEGDRKGRYHRKVHVPQCIWRSPKNVVRQFLSALLECDGHAYRKQPKTSLFTCYEEFGRDVQLLLLGFGINAKIAHEDKLSKSGSIFVGRSVQMLSEASNQFHREIGFISNRKRSTACVRPRKNKLGFENKLEDEVVRVSEAGVNKVYDLTIKETHRFGANGMLVHNTTGHESFVVSGYQIFNNKCQEFADSCVREPIALGDFDHHGRFHGCDTHKPKVYPPGGRDGFYPCFQADCTLDHTHDEAPCQIWEWPNATKTYCCGADIAEGLGGKSAFSVGVVIEVSQTGGGDRQVATWRDNETGPIQFAAKLAFLGKMYNECMMCPECNKYDIVLAVMRQQHNYGNLYRWKNLDSINMMSGKLGWYTQHSSRPRLWQTLRSWLQQEVFTIRSRNCAEEMKNFTKEYEDDIMASGDREETDDELMACMIALYCAHETDYSDSLGLVVPKTEMTTGNSTFVCRCQNCGHTWPENAIPDSMLDPSEFIPDVDVTRQTVQSGGFRCAKCGNRGIEINRNPAMANPERTMEAGLVREATSSWSPEQEWTKWSQAQNFDDQNAVY